MIKKNALSILTFFMLVASSNALTATIHSIGIANSSALQTPIPLSIFIFGSVLMVLGLTFYPNKRTTAFEGRLNRQ